MKHLNRLTLLGAMLVGAALPAQESVGTIRGSVTDPKGRPVPGALVTLTGDALLGQRSAMTDDKGEYRLPLILPGTYTLSLSKADFVGSRATVQLTAGQTLRQDLRLRPVEVIGTVVVIEAPTAQLDKTDTKTASTLSFEQLQSLPMGGSINALGALSISPGVTGATDYAVIRGGIVGSAQYTVNGIVVRDPASGQGSSSAWILDDLIEDIAIIQSPLNAKYGHTSSGTANVVTKTGSNTFSGSIRLRGDRADWSAYSNTSSNRFQSPMTGSTNGSALVLPPQAVMSDEITKVWEISILGPIIKNHLTFSYGTRVTPSRTLINSYGPPTNLLGSNPTGYQTYIPIAGLLGNPLAAYTWGVNPLAPTVPTQISGPATDRFNQYKLFWQITPSQQLELGFSRNTYTDQRYDNATSTGSPGVDPAISANQPATRDLTQVNYRGTLGSFAMLEINYGKRLSVINFPTGPQDPLYVRTYSSTATTLNTTTTSTTRLYQAMGADAPNVPQERSSETIKANLQLLLGNHQIDTGLDILAERQLTSSATGINNQAWYAPARLANGDFLVYNYVGSYASGTTATAVAMRNESYSYNGGWIPELRRWDTIGPTMTNVVRSSALYVNDLYKFNERLSVNLGVRYEKWTIDDRQGSRLNTHGVSPRLMVQWDLLGDNRHLLSFSSAQYRGTLNQATLGQFIYYAGNVRRRYFWNQGSTTPYAVSPAEFFNPSNYGYYYRFANVSDYRRIDPNLKPEKTQELELKYRRALENGAWVRVSADYRRTSDMMLAAGYDTKITMTDPTGAASALSSDALLRIAQLDPIAYREYKGFEIEWNCPVTTGNAWNLTWGGNWTISRLVGRDDYTTAGSFQNYEANNKAGVPVDVYNPFGELVGSARNMLKTWFTYEHGTRGGIRNVFTLLGKYESGAPAGNLTRTYNYPAGTWTSGASDIPSTVIGNLNGRGRRRGMDYAACDLTWGLTIPIKAKIHFFSMLVISQVFNSQFPSGVNYGTASPSTNPIWPGTAVSNNVILGQNTMHEWGTVSGWDGVRSISTLHFGIKF